MLDCGRYKLYSVHHRNEDYVIYHNNLCGMSCNLCITVSWTYCHMWVACVTGSRTYYHMWVVCAVMYTSSIDDIL